MTSNNYNTRRGFINYCREQARQLIDEALLEIDAIEMTALGYNCDAAKKDRVRPDDLGAVIALKGPLQRAQRDLAKRKPKRNGGAK